VTHVSFLNIYIYIYIYIYIKKKHELIHETLVNVVRTLLIETEKLQYILKNKEQIKTTKVLMT